MLPNINITVLIFPVIVLVREPLGGGGGGVLGDIPGTEG